MNGEDSDALGELSHYFFLPRELKAQAQQVGLELVGVELSDFFEVEEKFGF
jgi:hypothetical protein